MLTKKDLINLIAYSNIKIKKITRKNLHVINHNIKLFKLLEKEDILEKITFSNNTVLQNKKVIQLNKKPLETSFHYIYKKNA